MGFLHDLGKAMPEWQQMLRDSVLKGVHRRIPHAAHGAAFARHLGLVDVAFAIAGHHAGVPNQDVLDERCEEYWDLAQAAFGLLDTECANTGIHSASYLDATPMSVLGFTQRLRLDLRVRMLSSILTDGDRTNSATRTITYPHRLISAPSALLEKLLNVTGKKSANTRVEAVRRTRSEVLKQCLEAASWDERLVTLNAPTGSGKTLATLAYGLARAMERPSEVRRIIIVIPYLSIIEQNAGVIAEIVGASNVFEHHSGNLISNEDAEDPGLRNDARRDLAENWNVPVVVTTSVRFFETLFSNHPSDIRRLHSVANSVVIIDEVQTFPRQCLASMWSMLRGLVDDFGVTCLLSSATLPDFDAAVRPIERSLRELNLAAPREILRSRRESHRVLQRVRVLWPSKVESIAEVASQLLAHERVLAVVNLKRDALALFGALKDGLLKGGSSDATNVWHLSTSMCAAHRRDVLDRIRDDVSAKQPCRVVSTQLVEAGVDLDFPVVFRAVAPLDAIAQAAGRCDREGHMTDAAGCPAGIVNVFDLGPEHELRRGTAYRQGGDITRSRLLADPDLDISSPTVFDDFYREWFASGDLDARNIQSMRRRLAIRDVNDEFRYIDEPTCAVLVPYGEDGEMLIEDLREGRAITKDQWQRLYRYAVAVYPYQLASLERSGAVSQVSHDLGVWVAEPRAYDAMTGLSAITEEITLIV